MRIYFAYPTKCMDREIHIIRKVIRDLGLYSFGWEHAMVGEPDSAYFHVPANQIKSAECFVGLVGHTYGMIFPKDYFGPDTTDGEISYFHLEFKRAEEAGIPMLIFMQPDYDPDGNPLALADGCCEQDETRKAKMRDFRDSLHKKYFCQFFHSPGQLKEMVGASLVRQIHKLKLGNPENRDIVFISHAKEDDEFVDSLKDRLCESGAYTWVDHHNHILPGAFWDPTLEHTLNAANALIVVITPEAIRSGNVAAEWSYFATLGKPIYPILLKGNEVPFRLRVWQYLDFRTPENREAGLNILIDALGCVPQGGTAE